MAYCPCAECNEKRAAEFMKVIAAQGPKLNPFPAMYCVLCDQQHSIYVPCARPAAKYDDAFKLAPQTLDRIEKIVRRSKPVAPAAPPAPDTDRIWDLIVLAARTSRYGG
jgi:hypothetical protein